MIFTRLRLNNFKSHKNTTIDFNKGISVIVGENGAGKSTILEAINFALFKQHSAKLDDLVRNNADAMSVELQFISNGKEYKIVREKNPILKSSIFTKTSTDSGFIHICTGDDEVDEQVKEILDIDSELFSNAMYIRQGEIVDLIDKTPAEKKHLINKLLGLNSLENAWNNLLPFINDYENKKSEIKGKLFNSNELKDEYDKKKAELNVLKDRGHELEEQIADVTESLKSISENKRDMEREKEIHEKQLKNLETEKSNLSKLESEKRDLQENIDKIRDAEDQISRLEKFVSKLDVYLDFEKSVVNIQKLKEEENEISDKLDKIAGYNSILIDKREDYNKFLGLNEDISRLDSQKIQYEKDLASMAKLEKDKKELLESIENERNEIGDFFSKSKDKLEEYDLSQDVLDEIDDFSHLENATSDFADETSKKIKHLSEEIISKNEEIALLKHNLDSSRKSIEELEDVDDKCPICKSDIDSNRKEELIKQHEFEIEENTNLVSQYEQDLQDLINDKDESEEKFILLGELSKNIVEYKQKFGHLENELVKLKKIDGDLTSRELISNKLGELILLIADKRNKRDVCKTDYEDYNKAKGALEVLGDETDIQYKLKLVKNEIDNHVKNIKLAINQDPHLSGDISAKELQDRIEDLKQKNDEFNQLKGFIKNKNNLMTQIDSIKEDIGLSLNQINITENKIKASVYDNEKYEQIVYQFERYERRKDSFTNELSELKGRARESIANLKELGDKITTVDKFHQEYNDISDYINLLNHIRNLYGEDGIQKDLKNISKPLIEKHTKEFFNEFNFDYSDLTLDDDYEVAIYGPEGESSMDMVSGGEKIAIALALRLGITQAMSKGDLDTILLDEPTIHLDPSRRHELINLLKDMSALPQMIIVTHESQLENAADNLIKVEKENGISKVIL